MKRALSISVFLILSIFLSAQKRDDDSLSQIYKTKEATIFGQRPLKEIGIQKTNLDSLALRENIILSIADVLTYRTPLFIKNWGRATFSTVSFRGTSPSHTQVTWNGIKINNPMLGMTDFSTIPAYFIDDVSLLHGTSSVNETGGGLGGAVKLSTLPANAKGFNIQYIQGIGSFNTFDEFFRLTYGNKKWQTSTRVSYSSSPNKYKYRNHDKKENVYDENMNIIEQYYPIEHNRSGSFKDLHILQELYYNTNKGDRFGLSAWYFNSNRELAMLTTDYGDETDFDNRQREQTFRSILSWDHFGKDWKTDIKCGYINSWMAYDYKRDLGNGVMAVMTRSRSYVNTIYGQADAEYYLGEKWLFSASLSAHQHFVESKDKNIISVEGNKAIVGYYKARIELSGAASVKWRPIERFGASLVIREEMCGSDWTPVIPAIFLDCIISKKGNVVLKASASKNFRFPTLNDLYFLPGGNPDLKKESGWNYDVGFSFDAEKKNLYTLSGSATWFDSYIDDWIIWLPTIKGFFSPRNIKKVHSYGTELKANLDLTLPKDWRIILNGTFAWTPSINIGKKLSPADRSINKQLPYIPELSATLTGTLNWKTWSFLYKWCYYSERYTMSSNDITLTGKLPDYFMSDIALEKRFYFKWANLSLKGIINNLFNEEYLSVLSRPMPGINFEIFISITPKWKYY